MGGYDTVKLARANGRATSSDYISGIFSDFCEMHGDRRFGDDKAIIAGIAMLRDMPVTVIGIEKGHDTNDKIKRNFGAAHPEGYRKALRQMKLAEKFSRPVVCIIDTSGAYCGIEAEKRGQGQAIAENLAEMMTLRTPIISLIVGEGGSGGALGLAVSDEVWMMRNSYYSVVSPEGCASILWKDVSRAAEAADCLCLTAGHLIQMGIVEREIPEDGDLADIYENIEGMLYDAFAQNIEMPIDELLNKRYEKFRAV